MNPTPVVGDDEARQTKPASCGCVSHVTVSACFLAQYFCRQNNSPLCLVVSQRAAPVSSFGCSRGLGPGPSLDGTFEPRHPSIHCLVGKHGPDRDRRRGAQVRVFRPISAWDGTMVPLPPSLIIHLAILPLSPSHFKVSRPPDRPTPRLHLPRTYERASTPLPT